METIQLQNMLAEFVHNVGGLVEFFLRPRGMGELGSFSFFSLMFGAGVTIYLVYQFVTWLANLVT